MFRSARWRNEKTKIKAVFKLQFHATQVSALNVDALVISVVPGDVGKPTARLEKGTICEGSCRWEYPIYETVKFNSDGKTGKINETIYRFIVSTGLSKNCTVGEVSIDFADYAEATKASTVSLPLKNSKSNAVLHVSIQKLQANVDQREVEETEDTSLKSHNKTLNTLLRNDDTGEGIKSQSNGEGNPNSATHNAELNGDCRASSGSDITMSSSDSSSGLNTPREFGLRNNILQDTTSSLSAGNHTSAPYKPMTNASATIHEEHQLSQWERHVDSDCGLSIDESTNGSRGMLTRENSQQVSDVEIENLKAEIVALARQVDLSELELQTLRKQIIKESRRGQDLWREVAVLKEERDALKAECEKTKAFQKRMEESKSKNKLQFESGDPRALFEEIREELNYEKDLNANLRLQLQKTQESNAELILAVKDLEEMLDEKNRELSDLCNKPRCSENAILRSDTDDDEEQKALEELVREHRDAREAYLLEQKLMDLCSEIEIYRRDKDELEMQMEQLALDYEILKQENHDMSCKLEQNQLQEQLKLQYDCSSSFAGINELEAQVQSLENELRKQSKGYSDSLVTIDQLESQIQSLENELKKQSKGYSDSLVTIHQLETQIQSLENELKKQSKGYSDSLATINQLETQIQSLENELKKQSKGYSDSLATINQLETQIHGREKELNKQSKENYNSSATINELEAYVKSLEEELEKQAQEYEADLEAVTSAKVEQEQRAIRAEDALLKTRWKNANTAEKLQEEFRRLSVQMASTFEANEKVAMKALAEANELHTEKSQLEEMLQKANEELRSVREYYEVKLDELSNQLKLKMEQIGQMVVEIDDKSKQLECQKKQEEEFNGAYSQEILRLKSELERITINNNLLSEQGKKKENMRHELEKMKASINQTEALVQRGTAERNELMSTIAFMKEEAEKLLEELNRMRCLKDEKETAVGLLQSDVETLKAQYNDLKHSLFEDELEKEKLRKQVFQLKGELKKKEEAFASSEKKLKESNKRGAVLDGIKTTPRNAKSAPVLHGSKELANLREKIKLLEGQIKLKETALETSANSFLEREKDLRSKIEELEIKVEELNENSAYFCDCAHQKLFKDTVVISNESIAADEARITEEYTSSPANGRVKSLVESNNGVLSGKEPKTNTVNSGDGNADEILSELVSLKERNRLMENELKEMQERYSEISLKFAEVEGERQQLVMTVRNLKNAKKK